MADAKIQIKIGSVEFSGEGEQAWVADQLEKVLKQSLDLLKIEPTKLEIADLGQGGAKDYKKPTNLALYLKETGATTIQNKKFLATAAFNQLAGKNRQTTADVTGALNSANQTRLGNPSDCLNQNVAKGFCQKEGGGGSFFVTDEGFSELGTST